ATQVPFPERPLASGWIAVALVVWAAVVVLAVEMSSHAVESYKAPRGEAGTPGSVTITGEGGGGRDMSDCAGTFLPDTGGRAVTGADVYMDGDCMPGRTLRGREIGRGDVYTPGGGEYQWIFEGMGMSLWIPVLWGPFKLVAERRKRRWLESAVRRSGTLGQQ
ncbi:hypothetical protein ACFQ07_09765, partial [Actinomadura adrarensis]